MKLRPDVAEPAARRALRLALAALWLLDAALQFQSSMFGPGFAGMLAAAARGNPALAAVPITWAAHLIGQHPALASAAFGVIQLALGLGIAWRPATKLALAGSAGWALAVWWLGEGFGGLLSGTASPVSGGPGPVVLYALLAVLLWPGGRPGHSPALTRAVWLLLWSGLAWLAVADAPAGTVALLRQPPGSALLAAAFALIAAAVLLPARVRRAAVVAAVALSLLLWAAGQDFGGIFTGTGTDPGSGPLLALLALAYWPARPVARRPRLRRRLAYRGQAGLAGQAGGCGPRLALPAAGRDAVIMQVLMGLGMAAMLLPGLLPVPPVTWSVLASLGIAWFGGRFLREVVRGRHAALDHVPHVLACGAMLYMVAAAMPGRPAPPAGVMTGVMAGAGTGPAPAVAVCLAAALAGCAVVLADRLAPPHPALAAALPATSAWNAAHKTPDTAGRTGAGGKTGTAGGIADAAGEAPAAAGGGLLARRAAACCQLAMGVGMACMLVQLL